MDRSPGAALARSGVAITFLAEGGALLLTSITGTIERVHSVYGIGLDNYRGHYLDEVNRLNASKRLHLPLYSPCEAKTRLDAGYPYPRQLTSWNAVYTCSNVTARG